MYKTRINSPTKGKERTRLRKLFLTGIFTLFISIATVDAQQAIQMEFQNKSIKDVFKELHQSAGIKFMYSSTDFNANKLVTAKFERATLDQVLTKVLSGLPVNYVIQDNTVIIKKKAANQSGKPARTLKGIVTDEKGAALPNVTIRTSASGTSIVSDAQGNFNIGVGEDSYLTFNMLGYEPQRLEIDTRDSYSVRMIPSYQKLEEVVVNVGYGTVHKSDLTGAVSQVKMEELNQAPVATLDQALAGRVAGVQVNSYDAQPGSSSEITIRGGNSLTQSNAPLYVVDGFPMEDFSLSSLNPADVESINILKDASASAIYGSRGANGVIIIETKKGKLGTPEITYQGYYGIQSPIRRMEMMSPYTFVKYQLELSPEGAKSLYLDKAGMTVEDYRSAPAIDWQSLLFRDAPMLNNMLSVRGASTHTKYAFSASHLKQDGVILNSGFDRMQFRANMEQNISSKIKTSLQINYAKDKNYGTLASEMKSSSNAYASYLIYRMLGYRPVANDVDLVNELIDPEDEFAIFLMNPLISTKNEIREENKSDLFVSAALDYNITKDLNFNVRGGYTQRFTKSQALYNSQTYKGFTSNWNPNGANGSYGDIELNSWVNENRLTYKKRLNPQHYFDVTGAFTLQGTSLENYGFETDRITNEHLGLRALDYGIPKNVKSILSSNTLASFLARVNYNYKSKYLLTGSIRADGSSKFSKANRWGVFPSAAFAWQLGKEDFLKAVSWINDAKLRVSYGVTGNNRINDFVRFQTLDITDYYSFGNQLPYYAAVLSGMGNADLRWESTAQWDIGYDMTLLKNRIDLNIDVYQKNTTDLLLNANIPLATGFGNVYKNVGEVRNRGVEVAIRSTNIRNKNFSWETAFNISFNENTIMKLSDGQSNILSWVNFTGDYNGSFSYIGKVGGPASTIYGYVWDGNYQVEDFDRVGSTYVLKAGVPNNGNASVQPGDIKYVDYNRDGTVNEKDMVEIGRALPRHIGGLQNNFTYKGISLGVLFQWNYGNDIINANRLAFEGNMGNRIGLNQFASYEDRWTPENPTDENFRVGGFGPKGRYSTKIIEDGSYLRLKTVQLSYTFPKRLRGKLKGLEVYTAGQNLITWTKYSGYDPQVSVRHSNLTPGFDYSSYPRSLTVTAGVKASF
ncbi:SusC/RagA family TonB-linked outer membrane protein [Sphingobacterium psychroaquaticum]|uniref:TonB-dependent receptor n=1 Tax=Sphingobacterium psychroaquaticum TaxID=561061 RepID=UPI00106BE731|nr:TonB-dependent receptor [Sphingobacterium psychroaquaticum]QBQ40648.1 SusC/RagA family TonB-linked outer membrane protein [Sphingobacterium psychroaquaticum]